MKHSMHENPEDSHSAEQEHSCCKPESPAQKAWYKRLLFFTLGGAGLLYVLTYFVPALVHYRHSFDMYLKMIFLPVVAGLLFGGIIDHFIPSTYISKTLTGARRRVVFYSAGLGFLMSACSHGILALSMELHKKGASGPAVITFLLASPWANLPVTFLMIGFFGWKSVLLIFGALLVAVNTGLILQVLERKGLIEKNRHVVTVEQSFSIRKDLAARWKDYHFSTAGLARDFIGILRGSITLADMVLGWIVFGMVLASLISAFVPASIFDRFMGPSLLGLVVTLGVAAVLEVCSEGTSPLAFEIYRRTNAFGNAFAFLTAGVVTDYTEIGLVWINLGKKTALWMMAAALPQIILLGALYNLIP